MLNKSMRVYSRNFAAGLGILLLATMALPRLRADALDKKVVMTFSAPFAVPGNRVLPAGTYVFKTPGGISENMVEIMNGDESRPIGMFATIPEFEANIPDRVNVQFEERAAGAPPALKSWTYPGEEYGFELLY
jgi:hypothetical protein